MLQSYLWSISNHAASKESCFLFNVSLTFFLLTVAPTGRLLDRSGRWDQGVDGQDVAASLGSLMEDAIQQKCHPGSFISK